MVRQCEICKKNGISNPDLSFHKFPSDTEKRKIWASLLGFESIDFTKKLVFICSNHFNPNDIGIRANGTKFLKPDVMPLPYHAAFEIPSESSDTVSEQEVTHNSPATETILLGVPSNPNDAEALSLSSSSSATLTASSSATLTASSSVTITASECENELSNLVFVEPSSQKVLRKKRKRCYFGDMSSSDFSTPEKRRKSLHGVKKIISKQRVKIHTLQNKVRRQKLRIESLKSLVSCLTEKFRLSEESEHTILASIPKTAGDLFKRMLRGPSRQKYDPSLRSFALTLAFYSPKAYNYVRKTFNDSLPHLGTISKWYRSVNGSPGFTKESLIALTLKKHNSPIPVLCNLVLDEMSIRQQVEWTGQKFTGYVDIGTNLDSDALPEAREVLVFMLVCINGSWKVPVGYFLLNGLSATEKSELLKKCLEFINESGITVTSITFDGTATNFSMAEKLGADFSNHSDLRTSFIDPITKNEIFIYLDACHMIKLVRNCFASQIGLKNRNQQKIQWNFVEKLVDIQNREGLHAATKMRMRHLQWSREKMKVRLATQTLSRSVSDALRFMCRDLKHSDFLESEATAEFILLFNNLFDILNSRNTFAKYEFKKPLSRETAEFFFHFIDKMVDYILGLTLNDIPILESPRKTGFLGLLICMASLRKMFTIYVVEKEYMRYILCHKLSQDHLELFFGAIRSKGGYNNNPTARQFEASYKRLLIRSEIAASNSGNAINLEAIPILTCGSGATIKFSENGRNLEEDGEYLSFMEKTKNDLREYNFIGTGAWDLTPYVEDIVGYISGFVVRGVKKCLTCVKCSDLLESNVTVSLLQQHKTYGKLIKCSTMTYEICKVAEKYFRFFHKTSNIFNPKADSILYQILINGTMEIMPLSVFESFGDHLYDDNPVDGHSMELIKMILKNYFKLRIHHETMKNLDLKRTARSRSLYTKMILFRNE